MYGNWFLIKNLIKVKPEKVKINKYNIMADDI